MKNIPGQKVLEKAFAGAAERAGLQRDETDEIAVPEYGLMEVGKRLDDLGDLRAELNVAGSGAVELRWIKADGKSQKWVPKAVKEGFAEELMELRTAGKDILKMLSVQKERIDQLHLKQKSWEYKVWRERYLDHPLVGVLARRLIWKFGVEGNECAFTWLDGKRVSECGKCVNKLNDSTPVSLWHPIGKQSEEIMAWRDFLEKYQIRQPFKQAHREICLLTDAEQATEVYSNRYAAHIIKQHQFNALCGVRGWKNSLQLMVDQDFPPAHLNIPAYDLRAEFWVNGAGEGYGVDTNETGTFYMATDQVRFYPIDHPVGPEERVMVRIMAMSRPSRWGCGMFRRWCFQR